MMIVARKCATSNGVSLNAVGFTGSLLAKNEEEVEKLKNIKIIEILENLAENENDIFEDDVIECWILYIIMRKILIFNLLFYFYILDI